MISEPPSQGSAVPGDPEGRSQRGPGQLPPGRHGLPRDYVAEHQRERILTALTRVVAERGYAELTVEAVVASAGVSRRTFYQHFGNKEEAYLAAYDAFAARLLDAVARVHRPEAAFCAQVSATLRAALSLLAEHPDETHLLIVEVLVVSPAAVERRAAALRLLTDIVHRTTCELAVAQGKQPPPMITAEAVVGGLAEVVYNRVQRGEAARLRELVPDLTYCVLLPYVGADVAAAEHARLTAELAAD